ncbi:MAG: hypothetical protein ACPGNV_16135 [Mangrovicoccus sp.]
MGNFAQKFSLGALVTVAVLASCSATSHNISRQIPYTDDFILIRKRWEPDYVKPKFLHFIGAKAIDVDGMLEVCGLWVTIGPANAETYHVLKDMAVTVQGQPVIQGLQFFKKQPSNSSPKNAVANCAPTGRATPKGDLTVGFADAKGRPYRGG